MAEQENTDQMKDRLRDVLVSSLIQVEGWSSMTNDIEKYQKIKSLTIEAFRVILVLAPMQAQIVIQERIDNMEGLEPLFEYDELLGFLRLAQIHATGLLSHLDDEEIPDFAAPHQAINILDNFLRKNDGSKYSEDQLNTMGAAFSFELRSLNVQIEKIDWQKGWD